MIEQQGTQLLISFPTSEEAQTFARVLDLLFKMQISPHEPAISGPPSESPQPDSPEPVRSHRVLLTPERQEQLFNQRQQGQSARQRIQNAQTTLRDGVLPFSKPGEAPRPTSQPSPRMRGVFADGGAAPVGPKAPGVQPEVGRRSKLRPVVP